MPGIVTLLKEMRQVQRELGQAALDARRDPSQRQRVIVLRRQSNEAVLRVSAQTHVDPLFIDNPELGVEFRQRFSDLRSKVAVFQAKWPAVLLSDNDPEFELSAKEMRQANREFDEWVARALV